MKIHKTTLKEVPKHLAKAKIGNQYAIITDSVTKRLYGNMLLGEMKKAGLEAHLFALPKGEKAKSLQSIQEIAEQMLTKGFDRKDAIITLGGGVVGDAAGFLASIYMRGIPYVHIPTTLLAMVDSSIGGKTGVNLQSGKNLLGRVEKPQAIFFDINLLKTLPQKQLRNGMAEVIKAAVIRDAKLFTYLEKNIKKALDGDQKVLEKIITAAANIKLNVVEKDLNEKKLRMILNYGHTYGHVLEKESNYTLLHGYAISIGMVIANKLAIKEGFLKEEDALRIRTLLKAAGLPTTTLKVPPLSALANDKKCFDGYINFILPTKIGDVKIHKIKCQ